MRSSTPTGYWGPPTSTIDWLWIRHAPRYTAAVYQQCDETPMVWSILAWIYIVYNNEIEQIPIKNANNYVIAFLTTIGAIFTVVHAIYRFTTVFQVFFGVLVQDGCVCTTLR
ncbi:hypothetical protein PInf_015548 [Phytophthora infestans]|nr:hypothetical protein PInf_015548 [Phytophthora infestans]